MTFPILLHITPHKTDCPGAAGAFLQPNKGAAGANSPGLLNLVLPFRPPLKSLFAQASRLPPFEVVLFCSWKNACHYSRLHLGSLLSFGVEI